MAAGDLLTADYQAELRAVLMGPGTNYQIGPDGISGLGVPQAKTADTDLAHADGAYGSRDYRGVRVITIPLLIGGGTPAQAMTRLTTLTAAWAPATTDIELHLQLPGWGHVKVSGRPRGLDEDLADLRAGEIACLATFVALNPTITTVV